MLVAAVLLLAVAGVRLVRFLGQRGTPNEVAYFYDLSERKLFVAARTLLPPIRGINNDEMDGMRAIVISTTGNPSDKASHKIAYLETYSPELKRQLEAMRAGDESASNGPRISRGAAQAFTFVRRVSEETWHPSNSPEAEKVMTEWLVPGPDGTMPVACTP